jgi:hypothetical protein
METAAEIADPRTWWVKLVDAVNGLKRGSQDAAKQYLQFVERHRGRAIAERAMKHLRTLQASPAWSGSENWPAWGYQCKPPAKGKR